MKPISIQSKASVTTVVFIDFCLKKLNVFSQNICQKQMNIWIPQNKSQQITRSWNINLVSVLITFWDITNDAASTYCEMS